MKLRRRMLIVAEGAARARGIDNHVLHSHAIAFEELRIA